MTVSSSASSGAWYRIGSVSIANGIREVTGHGSLWQSSLNPIAIGDILTLDSQTFYEVVSIDSDERLFLDREYESGNATEANYAIIRNTSGTLLTRLAGQIATQFNQKQLFLDELRTWLNSHAEATLLTDSHGITQSIKTPAHMIAELEAQLIDNHDKINAPKAEAISMASGGKMVALVDENGNTNLFYRVPVFSYADIGKSTSMGDGICSAFLKPDGSHYSELLIGAVPASVVDEQCVVVPGNTPKVNVNITEAKEYCADMGEGYHLMTTHEWAAVALWCEANDFQPRGNTFYGRNHGVMHEAATREDGLAPADTNGSGLTSGGTGPVSWNHNGKTFGISDLVGNIWEWSDGMKLVDGRLVVSTFSQDSEDEWIEQMAYLDADNKLAAARTIDIDDGGVNWAQLGKTDDYVANQLLRRLLIEPEDTYLSGRLYYKNVGEVFAIRGGSWISGANGGLGALYIKFSRGSRQSNLSFRPVLAR